MRDQTPKGSKLVRHAEKQQLYRNNCTTNASITTDSNLFKNKQNKTKTRKQCIMRGQTHKVIKCIVVFAGLGKYPDPG